MKPTVIYETAHFSAENKTPNADEPHVFRLTHKRKGVVIGKYCNGIFVFQPGIGLRTSELTEITEIVMLLGMPPQIAQQTMDIYKIIRSNKNNIK